MLGRQAGTDNLRKAVIQVAVTVIGGSVLLGGALGYLAARMILGD